MSDSATEQVSNEELARWLNENRIADGEVMSDARLSEVWNLVRPASNWKYSISATVAQHKATRQEIETAVLWFAGGVPTITEVFDHWYVTGAGYYEWCGA